MGVRTKRSRGRGAGETREQGVLGGVDMGLEEELGVQKEPL